MGNNPYHDQHIAEFTQCMEQAFNDSNNYYDQHFNRMLEALEALERRVTRLEEAVFKAPEGAKTKVEAEVVVTKDSLRKVRDAIMNLFR